MINNIRYKGNINNTFVIIFESLKLPAMVLCLGEPPRRFLWCCSSFHFWSSFCCSIFISFLIFILLQYLHFIFDLHFAVVLHIHVLHFVVVFIHISFSTSSLTLLWTIVGFLYPFYTFSAAHRRVIRDTFISNHSVNLLVASATALSGHLLPTGIFYLMLSFTSILTRIYQGFPGSRQLFFEVCRASYWFLETQTQPICLFDSQ